VQAEDWKYGAVSYCYSPVDAAPLGQQRKISAVACTGSRCRDPVPSQGVLVVWHFSEIASGWPSGLSEIRNRQAA
jgi:hypothetical protein